jgi:hypothetical protein
VHVRVCVCVCVCDSDAPFEGKTVAQASFTGQRADPVRPVSRDAVPLASQKFLGTSEFQKAYPRHAVCESGRGWQGWAVFLDWRRGVWRWGRRLMEGWALDGLVVEGCVSVSWHPIVAQHAT